jgi:hypothetical protein
MGAGIFGLVSTQQEQEQERIMKLHRDAVATVVGLVLGVVAMAGTIHTDFYVQAAGAAARADQALFQTGVRP